MGEAASRESPPGGLLLPAVVHGGRIVAIERMTGALPWVDPDSLIVEGHLAAGTGDVEAATVQRPPGSGLCYAVVHVEVLPRRSISKYDYRLRPDGRAESVPCLGLSVNHDPVDARRWKVSTAAAVRMFFEVPLDTATVGLEPGLSVTVPLRTLEPIAFNPRGRQAAVGAPERQEPLTRQSETAPSPAEDATGSATDAAEKPEDRRITPSTPDAAASAERTDEAETKPEAEAAPAADVLDF